MILQLPQKSRAEEWLLIISTSHTGRLQIAIQMEQTLPSNKAAFSDALERGLLISGGLLQGQLMLL